MLRRLPSIEPTWIALWIWSGALIVCGLRFVPPAPAADESLHFAGQHALDVLNRIVVDDTPRPLGSRAHKETRTRIQKEIRRMGFAPRCEKNWACSHLGQCGLVENITVEIPGERDDVVLFSAHTDSALSGSGAADDGHAVAILLELARHISRGTTAPKNTVLLLFTDGEEEGMLGATSFVERNPIAARVAVAVNLEARGNAGISMLFQTLGEDAWLIDAYARKARRPYASSVAQAVYELMPNYTDLSALQSFGIPGVDFAFIDGEAAYHSPLDTVDRLSPGALQSQGDNALAMLRALGSADLRDPRRGYASWFDVVGLFVVRTPRGWVFPIALFLWMSLGTAAFILRRQGRCKARKIVATVGLSLALVLVAALGGWALCKPLELATGEIRFWQAHPGPITAGLVCLAVSCQVVLARRFSVAAADLVLGLLVFLSTLSLPIALFAPGAAYLFWVPAGIGVLALPALCRQKKTGTANEGLFFVSVAALCGVSALLLWLPTLHGLRLALGVSPILCGGAAVGGLMLWPLWTQAKSRVVYGLLAATLGGALVTYVQGPSSADAPRRQWLTRIVDEQTIRVVRGPGPTVDAAMRIRGRDVTPNHDDVVLREARDIPGPVIEERQIFHGERPGQTRVSFRLRSPTRAPTLVVWVPQAAGLQHFHIEDTGMPRGSIQKKDRRVEIHNVPPTGVHIQAVVTHPEIPWRIADRRPWLAPPKDLRDADAHTSWDGDTTWVLTEANLVDTQGTP